MKKGIISKLLTALLLVGLLFSILPSQQAQAATTVTDEAGLRTALADTTVSEIELGNSFSLAATVNVERSVTIDGKNFTITGPSVQGSERWEGHGIQVLANDVVIKNLTITSSARTNLQFFDVTGGSVTNATLASAANAGMIVNGSEVTISGVKTTGNAWGGINVDKGSASKTPHLTVLNATNHTSPTGGTIPTPAIWVDKGNAGWVSAPFGYAIVPGTPLSFFDNTEFAASSLATEYRVHNSTQGTYHATIQSGIDAADTGEVLSVAAGTYVENLLLTKPITLQGDGETTIIQGDIRYQSETLIPGTMTLKDVMVDDSAAGFRMGEGRVGAFDKVVIDNVTMTPNTDHTNRAISFDTVSGSEGEGDTPTLNSLTIKNSRVHSTLSVYLTGTVGEIVIHDNDFYVTKHHWSSYNAININQYPGVPAGVYSITDNCIHVPNTAYGHATAITNQGLNDLARGNELIATGNSIQVGTGTPNTDQSTFIWDKVVETNAAYTVINQTKGTGYTTIQAAIDAASDGDTINVAAGEYAEIVTINKPLTLLGPNSAINPNTGTREAEASILFPAGLTVDTNLVTVEADDVTISGFTLNGKDLGPTLLGEGIYSKGNNLTVTNNIVKNFTKTGIRAAAPFGGPYYTNALVENNQLFSDVTGIYFSYSGIYIQGTQGVVRGNVVNNAYRGIQVQPYTNSSTVLGVVENNSFTAYKSPAYFNYSHNAAANWVFRKNILTGLESPTAPVDVFAGIIVQNYAGGNVLFDKNQVYLGTANGLVNHLYHEIDMLGGSRSASPNYWGAATGPAAGMIAGDVSYVPWCQDPECTILFTPPVHNTTKGTYFNTITAAVNAAVDGDEITVAAGVYDEENILITKGIKLQGAGAATTSIAPSAVTNNSTFIVRNPSGNVTIDGFNFVMQPKPSYGSAVVVEGQVIAVDSATVTISNNIVTGSDDGSKSDYGFYGQGNNAKVVITGNVINKPGDNPITFEKQFGSTSVTNNTINITANPDYNPYYSMVYEGTVSTPQIVEGNTFNLVHSGSGYAEAITFTTSPRGRWGGAPDEIGHYTDIQIKNNVINTGGPYARGIGIYDRSQGSGYGTITGAVITGNQIIGENLLDDETYGVTLRGDVQGSVITGNVISNVNIGAWIRPGEDAGGTCPSGNDISMNQITSVTTNVKNDCVTGKVDASPNWWGKADGPADGSIVGDVAYLPYCTNEGCTEFSKAGLYMTPDTVGTTDTCTGTQTVEVYVQDVAWLTAYEIEVLFNPALVEVTAVTNGGWLDPDGTPPPGPYIDNVNGKINFGWAAFGGGDGLSKPSTGTGSLMKITFRARNLAGTSAFTINAANSLLVGWEPGNEGMPIEFDVTGSASVTYGSIVTNVTKIPEVSYCNLATAVTQATAGDTLRADKDFTTTAQVNVTKNLTFDTNGHTITRVNASSAYDAVFQVRTVHLTITGGGTINSTSSSGDFGAAIYMWAGNATGATVTLEDATLSGKNTSVYVTAGAHSITGVIYPAVYNMTGGTVTDGIFVIRPAAELNITGGTVKGFAPIQGNGSAGMGGTKITIGGTAVIDGDDSIAIYHPQNGELTINGGTIIGTNAIEMKAGKLVVTDGTITGTGPFVETPTAISGYSTDTGDAILLFSAAGYTGDLSVDIQGGTITSDKAYALREFTTEATTRTKSIKVSDGTLNGGLGTDNADEAVFFSTVDPTVLQLTGGRYNTDPGDSPDYVYEPLDTYLHTDDYYHIMGIVAGTFEPFPADGLVIGPETITDTINYSGAIPWYNAAPTLNRVQGNRVGMKVIEPEGVDLTGATIKIYRDGIQYYTGGWNASKDAASDNFVPYWALVTNIPQDYKIVVNWNAVSEQTFFAHVLEGSTLVAPPAPIISSTDIQGYYLAGDERGFSVSMKNPDLGANYARMIFDYKLAGVTTADIDSFEYLAQDTGEWIPMGSRAFETYDNCTDNTGVCGQFGWAPGGFGPVTAGFENTSEFRIKFNKGFTAPLAFTLDLSGKLDVADADWTLLTTYNGSLDVHDKPVITVVTDPYFIVNEEGKFSVTIANPATGRNYGNNVVFDLVIPGHLPADFESMSCGFGGTTWPVTLQADGNGGSITRIGGLDGFFNITAPFGPMTVNCTVTLKTSGEYSVTGKMTDTLATPELTDDRVIQTSSGEVKAYTKPTITATFPTGPIAAGVPVTVPVTITNPDGLPGPFGLVLDLPDGATIVYGGATYLCGDDPLTEDDVEVGCPVIPVDAPLTAGELVITFPGNGTVDVTIELFDTAADPDRKLADTTITDVVIGGDYAVTGYFWLQGTSRRHDIPVIFTWGGTLAPYGPTIKTVNTDTVNLTGTLTYGGEYLITTNQPRYLNYIAANRWKINVSGPMVLQSRRLLAGNAVWQGPEDYFVIDSNDSGLVANGYLHGVTGEYADADVNFDGRANIQDLALVGGNYMLTSQDAYGVAP